MNPLLLFEKRYSGFKKANLNYIESFGMLNWIRPHYYWISGRMDSETKIKGLALDQNMSSEYAFDIQVWPWKRRCCVTIYMYVAQWRTFPAMSLSAMHWLKLDIFLKLSAGYLSLGVKKKWRWRSILQIL